MEMLLSINVGSSSIKCKLYECETLLVLGHGVASGLDSNHPSISWQAPDEQTTVHDFTSTLGFEESLIKLLWIAQQDQAFSHLKYIVHRIVHGGPDYQSITLLDNVVVQHLEQWVSLAPLHMPNSLLIIRRFFVTHSSVQQFAVFDTAFHHDLPEYAYRYPLPRELIDSTDYRKFGFHGLACESVLRQLATYSSCSASDLNVIVVHLGSGSSVTAIQAGKSVDTSMGFTPIDGLMMGTRCGNIDPGLILHLQKVHHLGVAELERVLYEKSGLLAICGQSDLRIIRHNLAAGDETAKLAYDMFCSQIKKYIGAYVAILGEVNAVVFSGGIGRNDAQLRGDVCNGLSVLGLQLDENKNLNVSHFPADVSSPNSASRVMVMEVDEEFEMAVQLKSWIKNFSFQ